MQYFTTIQPYKKPWSWHVQQLYRTTLGAVATVGSFAVLLVMTDVTAAYFSTRWPLGYVIACLGLSPITGVISIGLGTYAVHKFDEWRTKNEPRPK